MGDVFHEGRVGHILMVPMNDLVQRLPEVYRQNSARFPAMKILACWLFSVTLPAALAATPARVARAGELEGKVEVQLHPADPWRQVTRNLPLTESAWLRTGTGARLEMELDDGSAFRLTGDALCEISDYTRLSTGQRVTVLSLDHGVAYFTGEPDRRDALILVLPGAQATVRVGARLRLEAREDATEFAVLEGKVRFSSPGAEMDLAEGEMTRVEKTSPSRFYLYREISPMDTDGWNEQRDKALATSGSARHLPGLRYGLVDLDTNGSWIISNDAGAVWKPKVPAGWIPYRNGQWIWYDEFGYTTAAGWKRAESDGSGRLPKLRSSNLAKPTGCARRAWSVGDL
jgi:hypothetical protein